MRCALTTSQQQLLRAFIDVSLFHKEVFITLVFYIVRYTCVLSRLDTFPCGENVNFTRRNFDSFLVSTIYSLNKEDLHTETTRISLCKKSNNNRYNYLTCSWLILFQIPSVSLFDVLTNSQ